MCLVGKNAVLAMALPEDFGGDELAEVNLAEPRVVAGRTDLPTSVRIPERGQHRRATSKALR